MLQRIKLFSAAALMGLGVMLAAQAQTIQAGKDYEVLTKPLAVDNSKKISVIEFFSYGCPHCYSFEAELSPWKNLNKSKIDFQASPVIFPGTRWGEAYFAEIYYTLEAMGLLEKYHEIVFTAVQKEQMNLGDEKILTAWLEKNKINAAKFAETRKSFGVNTQINAAKQRMNDAGVDSTPQIIVAGKYRVFSRGDFKTILSVADALITREAFAMKRSTK